MAPCNASKAVHIIVGLIGPPLAASLVGSAFMFSPLLPQDVTELQRGLHVIAHSGLIRNGDQTKGPGDADESETGSTPQAGALVLDMRRLARWTSSVLTPRIQIGSQPTWRCVLSHFAGY